ncbi:hypothetical protein PLGE761_02325 [Pluralibacter gergoviae]|nr:Uncharacterised protein [Pluralibacter gergoviae]
MKIRKWVRAEIMIIRQCAGTMRVESIASLIGRTAAAVRAKARELGVKLYLCGKYHQSVKYPESDVVLARELYQQGVTRAVIAEKLELPLGAVNQYVYFERRVWA